MGFTVPVLIDENDGIIAGHCRIMAAGENGLDDVPVVVARGWSDAQKRAYVLADNKLTENGGWGNDLLQAEIGALESLGFDISLTGFTLGDLEPLLAERIFEEARRWDATESEVWQVMREFYER